jgi:hypothetical protein
MVSGNPHMTNLLVMGLLTLGGVSLLCFTVALVRVRRRRLARNLGVVSERWLAMNKLERW